MQLSKRDFIILNKIIKYCDDIERTVKRFGDDFEIFSHDTDYRNSVAMCILQIGELANNLTPEFRSENPSMPWQDIRGMRNVVAHAYGDISIKSTWNTVKDDIPTLKKFCKEIIG